MRNPPALALCLFAASCVEPAADPPSNDTLDPEVLAIMRHQEALEPALTAIYEQHMRSPGSGFAGLAFEGDGLALYYKGELSPEMATALADARRSGSIEVRAAPFSLAELEADGAAIDAAVRSHGVSDIQSVAFRYDGTGLDVERLPVDAAASLATRRTRAGKSPLVPADQILREVSLRAPVALTVADGIAELASSRTADTRPWNGGGLWTAYHDTNHDGIGDTHAADCTTGFGVMASGRSWILTAAHCASIGDVAYHSFFSAANRMGPIFSDQNAYDLLLIDTAGYHLIFDGPPNTSVTKHVNTWGYFATNQLVCQSGVVSGTVCWIKTGNSQNITVSNKNSDGQTGFTIYGVISATKQQVSGQDLVAMRSGDSGAPVFTLDGTGVRAKGIASGMADGSNGRTMFFQDWADVIRLFGAYPRND